MTWRERLSFAVHERCLYNTQLSLSIEILRIASEATCASSVLGALVFRICVKKKLPYIPIYIGAQASVR